MILVGKPDCHLCDVARQVIDVVCAELDEGWTELSVADDPGLAARYSEQVPVTIVDGQVLEIFRVNPDRLRAALAGS